MEVGCLTSLRAVMHMGNDGLRCARNKANQDQRRLGICSVSLAKRILQRLRHEEDGKTREGGSREGEGASDGRFDINGPRGGAGWLAGWKSRVNSLIGSEVLPKGCCDDGGVSASVVATALDVPGCMLALPRAQSVALTQVCFCRVSQTGQCVSQGRFSTVSWLETQAVFWCHARQPVGSWESFGCSTLWFALCFRC